MSTPAAVASRTRQAADTPRGARIRQAARRRRRALLVTAATALVALAVNVPWLYAIVVSLESDGQISQGALSGFFAPTLEHYRNALGASGYDFPRFFLNSALIASGTVVLVLAIAIPSIYVGVRMNFGGRLMMNVAGGLRLLPAIFFAVPYFLLMSNLALIDTVPGLILADAFVNLPLAIILLAAGFRDIPREVEEAAWLDGAGAYRTLWSILIPMLSSTLVSVAVLVFLFSWDDYLFALVLSSSQATPITLGAANFVTSTGIRWGDISAAAVLSTIPPAIFVTLAQKYLVRGLANGAVKG